MKIEYIKLGKPLLKGEELLFKIQKLGEIKAKVIRDKCFAAMEKMTGKTVF
ncbi:hypothetical protein [Chryseobacterium koreense]|uniref:hypothetical protein n=1 Tax=Chryseobacterium koreense TaxID=232216 RepID=UPI001364AC8C|nr:hypothetical protein [Chryseobacterium koreense]MBB5333445.1 hypothetical protein [Chryseobacterium koreense]